MNTELKNVEEIMESSQAEEAIVSKKEAKSETIPAAKIAGIVKELDAFIVEYADNLTDDQCKKIKDISARLSAYVGE